MPLLFKPKDKTIYIEVMKLTDKCKVDFEKWQKDEDWFENSSMFDIDYTNLELFNELPNSLKYGVYVDFFDSVGIVISIGFYKGVGNVKPYYQWDIEDIFSEDIETRKETRKEAIEKANEIRNKTLIIEQIKKPNTNIL